MKRPRLTLHEWEPAELELNPEDALALAGSPAGVAVEPLGFGHFRVTPSEQVGTLPLPGTDVVIRPKVGVRRLFFLLGYSSRLSFEDSPFPLEETEDVTDAVIEAFLGQVRLTLRRGPLMSYEPVEEALPTVRGRIRLLDQARRRFTLPLPLEVAYDEFTVDVDENRILKAALRKAQRFPLRDERAPRRITEILGALAEVSDVRYDARSIPPITITRLNRHYETSLNLARIILSSSTAELRHGRTFVPGFLIDMNKVFEDFVFSAIADELSVSGAHWRQGRGMDLDVGGRVVIRPDLSLWEHGNCCFVGDVKYKRTTLGENHDLYQVLAYARAAGLRHALIIYASVAKESAVHVIRNDGTKLQIRALSLQATDAEIRQSVTELAQLITELAGQPALTHA